MLQNLPLSGKIQQENGESDLSQNTKIPDQSSNFSTDFFRTPFILRRFIKNIY